MRELLTLEDKMRELRAIGDRLESGKLTLEAALAEYERGATLCREIDATLKLEEQKVDVISADGTITPFDRSARTPR